MIPTHLRGKKSYTLKLDGVHLQELEDALTAAGLMLCWDVGSDNLRVAYMPEWVKEKK